MRDYVLLVLPVSICGAVCESLDFARLYSSIADPSQHGYPYELATGGETVLHWACQTKVQNKEEVLQFLFDLVKSKPNGAISLLNIPDARGMTPLHYACSGNNKELVKKLLEKGADRKARDNHHGTPKERLDEDGQAYQEIADLLDTYCLQHTNEQASTGGATTDFSDPQDEAHFVSSETEVEVSDLKHHIINGQASTGGATGQEFRDVGNTVQVDSSDVRIQHIIDAIKAGHKSTIESWLQNEDINVNECRGGCAFPQHFAVANGTALHWAVYYGQLEIAKLLLDNYGADPNKRAQDGETVLHWACQTKIQNKEIIQLLLQPEHAKSLVNVSDDARRMTPLHFACSNNNKELVEELLEAGAWPEARDHYKATPMDRLDENEKHHQEIVALLDNYAQKYAQQQITDASRPSLEVDVVGKKVKYQKQKGNETERK